MDEFDSKRDMVQMLLQMLKQSASDEVSKGLMPPAPEEMPKDAHGIEMEKVSVLPHDEHEESPEEATLADKIMPHGEPEAHDDMEHNDEEPTTPAFASLMKRKLKK